MRPGFRQFAGNERGSTLILVVLLGLIMSAMAIVALRDVSRATQASAVYRTRTQAQSTSDSALRMFSDWLGQNAAVAIDAANRDLESKRSTSTSLLEAEEAITSGRRLNSTPLRLRVSWTVTAAAPRRLRRPDASRPYESGLFQLSATESTFESRRKSTWRVKVRDMVDGYPAPLWGPQFCFTKAVIAAEATIGETDPDWSGSNNVAVSRHVVDGMIGPRECGYGS